MYGFSSSDSKYHREYPIILDGDYCPVVSLNFQRKDFLWREHIIMETWRAQPRNELEMMEYENDVRFSQEVNPFLEEHWDAMSNEYEYHKAYLNTVDWDDLNNFVRGIHYNRECLKRKLSAQEIEVHKIQEKRCRANFHSLVSFTFYGK